MSYNVNLKKKEAKTIIKLGNLAVLNIINAHKEFLVENNLVYEGKILDIIMDVDGPNLVFNNKFEDWLFSNSSILKNKVQLILLIGDGHDRNRGNKGKTLRNRKKPGGNSDKKS